MAEYECYPAKLVVPGSEQEVIDIVRLTCCARLPVATRDSRLELAVPHHPLTLSSYAGSRKDVSWRSSNSRRVE